MIHEVVVKATRNVQSPGVDGKQCAPSGWRNSSAVLMYAQVLRNYVLQSSFITVTWGLITWSYMGNRQVLEWNSYGFVLISTRKNNEFEMHHAATDRNLGKSRADFELCLLQSINYSCLLSGPFGGFFCIFLARGPVPSGQALQSFPCLVCNSVAIVWALPEWGL